MLFSRSSAFTLSQSTMGEMGMFSGLLYCAECGGKMYQCRATNFAENQKYFICSTYRKGKGLCTTHSIKMSHDYELEQSNLKSMAEVLRKDLKQ